VVEVRVARDIARPAADVFAFLSDVTNNPRWFAARSKAIMTG